MLFQPHTMQSFEQHDPTLRLDTFYSQSCDTRVISNPDRDVAPLFCEFIFVIKIAATMPEIFVFDFYGEILTARFKELIC